MPNNLGELVPADLVAYTQDRLDGSDPGTASALDRALAAARRYCGWHVTPARTGHMVTLDGPGSGLLVLPTLRLAAITALVEDGVAVNLDMLEWSPRGLVRKVTNYGWWTRRLGGITVTMSHGFDTAPDWQAAVLSCADRMSLAGVGGRPTVVGPVQWPTEAMAAGSAFSATELAILQLYRLESPA